MTNLFSACNADPQFGQAHDAICADGEKALVYGVAASQKSILIASAYRTSPRQTVIVASGQESFEQLRTDLTSLLPAEKIVELPAQDIITFTAAAKSLELSAIRLDILSRLANGEEFIVLTTCEAAAQRVLPKQEFLNSRLTLGCGQTIDLEQIISSLVDFGYERVAEVDSLGQFCVRGGIIDIFAINSDFPIRLELFGDEIDSLRDFDPQSQRSVGERQIATVMPIVQKELKDHSDLLFSYLSQSAAIIFDEPSRIREKITKIIKENPQNSIVGWSDIAAACKSYNTVFLALLLQKIHNVDLTQTISITAKGIAPFHRQIDILIAELKRWQEKKYSIVILMSNQDKAASLKANLLEEKVSAVFSREIFDPVTKGTVMVTTGGLTGGFELPKAMVAVITEIDIFGRQKKKRRPRTNKDRQISYFRDIGIGDYVVHANHGIGKYVGVETLEANGIWRDYFHIKYAGEDKLYVPVDQVDLLQKYIGNEGDVPRLSRMGGSEWLKAKTKAKAAVADIAKELIELYARRQIQPGFQFMPDTPWQNEFEDAFPFEETPDQILAIEEVKKDMEQPVPMDRLLCGDVGFGKTEVAIRAAFKAALSGKQTALLVPTTVLAHQHYQTFKERFEGFGAAVDVISRFRSSKEQKATLKKLAEGNIDVIIGTHRILQKDIKFKDLGFLIIDEEQRFGVAQKEKLKKRRANLDILSLSATPIPRTLHMSLTGVRDMSIIETPPEDRYPVQSYVTEYSEEIIREAIVRELKRGGQVYFVYNRVATIDKMRQRLTEMLPDASIKTAHGQMPEEILEKVMLDFYQGRDDVLVCTSIIENGLDVPNANTIIIYDADYFGLSQLYQMRGRVGRSSRMAYAYFTYRKDKVLNEVAEKRLQAIKEFTELGSGFKIAMRDLEIRGAGSLLGREQHGHIVSIGFEMYCRLLEEAVRQMRGDADYKPPVEPVLTVNSDAYLPGDYINDAMHKIEIYQRIAAIRNEDEVKELIDELIDRFGNLPVPVLNLIIVVRIKNAARTAGVVSALEYKDKIEIVFGDNANITGDSIEKLRKFFKGKISFPPGQPQTVRLLTNTRSGKTSGLESIASFFEVFNPTNPGTEKNE